MVVELLIVLAVILLVVGSTKLPSLARGIGRSKQEYEAGQFDPVRPDPNHPPEPGSAAVRLGRCQTPRSWS